jgi:hypothetical protein
MSMECKYWSLHRKPLVVLRYNFVLTNYEMR